ncbi:MAG: CBS domain-containing protein, partial [Planctomycetales bacterium]|nr:CBS domain-containing protein [Planctomycetales bacterium]
MSLTAADIMQADAKSVAPDAPLLDVERAFIEEQVGGFPVLDDGRLVGVVSRSDIVRQLCVEQSLSEEASDYFRQFHEYIDNAEETLTVIAERVGRRIEHLSVDDVMRRNL